MQFLALQPIVTLQILLCFITALSSPTTTTHISSTITSENEGAGISNDIATEAATEQNTSPETVSETTTNLENKNEITSSTIDNNDASTQSTSSSNIKTDSVLTSLISTNTVSETTTALPNNEESPQTSNADTESSTVTSNESSNLEPSSTESVSGATTDVSHDDETVSSTQATVSGATTNVSHDDETVSSTEAISLDSTSKSTFVSGTSMVSPLVTDTTTTVDETTTTDAVNSNTDNGENVTDVTAYNNTQSSNDNGQKDNTIAEETTESYDQQRNNSNIESSDTSTVGQNTTHSANRLTFESIRLPQYVKPSIYEITMKPFIYENTPEPFQYECTTIINITCLTDTDVIKLHSVQHEILSVQITDVTKNDILDVAHFQLDTPTGMLGILLHNPLTAGMQYTLQIESTGLITDGLQGFYRSPYKVGNQTRYIVTTMMEPTDARMVFPCFDEPDFKAVFLFYVYRKEGFICLTNLPKRETIGPDEDGFYLDIFDQPRNVPMSTYLVAIAIGDLAYEEAFVRDIKFRTWSRPNAVHLTNFSLEIGVKTTEFFEDFFKIRYPLPKQDMIAVPTMSFNAMEHWGLITCREESMFYEKGVSSAADKEWTAILVAHEISHQWFGNIVSPKWWDELWLNEGFATYMMMLAVDRVKPEWEMMTKMPVDYRGTQNVFGVDDTLTSHPVYIPVEHPREIGEIFDLISYAKGSAVIRMMNFILGDETFQNGLVRFLKAYSYDTATHVDLWNSLSEQAREDNNIVTDVKEVMDTWIKEMNYPVVMVTREGDDVCLQQSAFLLSEEERQNRSHVFWNIPFTYTTDTNISFDKTPQEIVWLEKDGVRVCFQDDTTREAKWILGNIKQYGYFRVNYDVDNWRAILQQLSENHKVFHPINRAQIINDAWNLAAAGLLDFEVALGTFDYLDEELHFAPWKAAILNLDYIKRSLQLLPIYGNFQKFFRKKIEKAYLNSAGAQTHNDRIRYSLLGYHACQYGLQACVDDALERFNQWKSDENILVNPDMKAAVYCTGVKRGGADAWDFVLDKYLHEASSSERRFLVDALACTEEPWILYNLSQIVLFSPSDIFLSTDKIQAMSEMAKTPVGRMVVWNVIEEHYDFLFKIYGTELNLFPRLIKSITKPFNLPHELRRLERLADEKQHISETGPRLFSSVLSHVSSNIRWISAHYVQLDQWIRRSI